MKIDFVVRDIINTLPKGLLCICPDDNDERLHEHRNIWHGKTSLIVSPQNLKQICRIVQICEQYRCPITIQGGNTGVVGGQIPNSDHILLSTKNIRSIGSVNKNNMTVSVSPGATIKSINHLCKQYNLFLPLSLPDKATIGGAVAMNSGGMYVYKYGMTRNFVLGLQCVLANSSIYDTTENHKKSNMGLATDHIFIGSEGSLGIITKIKLQLHPLWSSSTTILLFYDSAQDAIHSVNAIEHLFPFNIIAIELIDPRFCLINSHFKDTIPYKGWIILIRLMNIEKKIAYTLSQKIPCTTSQVIALHDQEAKYWTLRSNLSHMQKIDSFISIKNDILLPKNNLNAFFQETQNQILSTVSESLPLFFGHIGDGNIHYDILLPISHKDKKDIIKKIILASLKKHHGSSIGEHGIGRIEEKQNIYKTHQTSKYNIDYAIKNMIDPHHIFNPHVLWKDTEATH